ncbi:MAG TPA: zinc-ribbon domain-containing protein [Methanoregula sp.]|nr:zinc-ribbon domain-containing protein [Methanoregula sp.]
MKLPWLRKKDEPGSLITCPRCNAPAPTSKPFCEACGARIAPPPSCSLCGTLLEPGSRFCPSCGAMIGSTKDKAVAESPKEIPARRTPATAKEKPPEKDDEGYGTHPDSPNTPSQAPGAVSGSLQEKQESRPATRTPAISAKTTIPPVRSQGLAARLGLGTSMIAIIILLVIAGVVLIFSGIFSLPAVSSPPIPAAQVIPETTPSPVTITATMVTPAPAGTPEGNALVPGPTQTLPAHLDIVLQAERDPRTRMISVEYMGGKGQYGVREIFVRLTRSDGEVLTGSFKPIQIGSRIELQGTEQADRLEVVTRHYSGEEYKIIDQVFEYKIRTA